MSLRAWVSRLLLGKPLPRMDDADFGAIEWQEAIDDQPGYWTMADEWTVPYQPQSISCLGIPGDRNGPSADARAFLLDLKTHPERAWSLAQSRLDEAMAQRPSWRGLAPQEVFHIAHFGKDRDSTKGWTVFFRTDDALEFMHVGLFLQGDQVVRCEVLP